MTQWNTEHDLVARYNAPTIGHIERSAHREYWHIARDFGCLFALAAFPFVLVFGGLSYVVAMTAPAWLINTIAFALVVSSIPVVIVLRGLGKAQWALTQIVAEWMDWQQVGREMAERRVIDSLDVRGINNKVTVSGPTYNTENRQRFNYDDNSINNVQNNNAPEQVRIVAFRGSAKLIDGVPQEDLIEFINELPVRGTTKRDWLGHVLPSGKKVSKYEDWKALVAPLEKIGIVEPAQEGRKSTWRTTDPREIKLALGLPHE